MTTVLVTGMGSTTALSVVKGLRDQCEIPVRIVGTDTHEHAQIAGAHFCDRFHRVPGARDPGYVPEMLRICAKEDVRVVFPIIDAELEVLAPVRGIFSERGVKVWLSHPETVDICNDKFRTCEFLAQHNVPVPKTWRPSQLADLKDPLRFPLIVKPVRGVSSIDVVRVGDPLELQIALKKVPNPIVQECLEGREFTIDVLSDDQGNVLAVSPRERLEVRAGISYKGRTVKDPVLIDYGRRIATLLRLEGPCNIQCLVAQSPFFFEINPRFSGTLALTVRAGVNGPLLLLKLALGHKLDKGYYEATDGIFMARYWEEVYYET